jgi:transposase
LSSSFGEDEQLHNLIYTLKTPAGAAIADVITSVVATAHHAGINTFDYLIALQRHADAVKTQPERWLPWHYHTAVQEQKQAA